MVEGLENQAQPFGPTSVHYWEAPENVRTGHMYKTVLRLIKEERLKAGRLAEILAMWKQSRPVPFPPLNFHGLQGQAKKRFSGCFLGPWGGVKKPQ